MKMKFLLALIALIGASGNTVAQTTVNAGIITTPANTNLMLRTNSSTTNRLTILNAAGSTQGFVSIGDNLTPTERLHVGGNILATGNLIITTGLLQVNHATNNFKLRLNATDRITVLNASGNVGIGTTSPTELLHVNGNARASQFNAANGVFNSVNSSSISLQTNGTARVTILNSNGNVGIGNSSPQYNLDVSGVINASTLKIAGNDVVSSQWATASSDIFYNTGNVSIGTSNSQGYKLAVNGKIISEEIVVKLYTNWPDYVFEPDYKLTPLTELQQFILENKHLPGVPAANQVSNNGIGLGELNATLLKKVEELTLYIIEQEKRITELEKQKSR
jgi:hypothetical protein